MSTERNFDLDKKIAKIEVRLDYIEESIDEIKDYIKITADVKSDINDLKKRMEALEDFKAFIIKTLITKFITLLMSGVIFGYLAYHMLSKSN